MWSHSPGIIQEIESWYHEKPMIRDVTNIILTMNIRLYWSKNPSCRDLLVMENKPFKSVAANAILNYALYFLCCRGDDDV